MKCEICQRLCSEYYKIQTNPIKIACVDCAQSMTGEVLLDKLGFFPENDIIIDVTDESIGTSDESIGTSDEHIINLFFGDEIGSMPTMLVEKNKSV